MPSATRSRVHCSHMQSNKCQSKLNFTDSDDFMRRARECCVIQYRRNGKWAVSPSLDCWPAAVVFFLSVITLCLSACLSVSSFTFSFYLLARYVVNASAIRTCINQHMPVIRFVFHLSTWRNHVRWHDYLLLLLLATEMSLIHISIEMY